MNTIIINGQKIQTNGKSISVIGNTVFVDGQVVKSGLSGIVEVKFEGDLASLRCDESATINGNVSSYVDVGGSLKCGDIIGNVKVGGSVKCGKVSGDIDAGGSVSRSLF